MPITYKVNLDGHIIVARVSGIVTGEEFVEYELAHATDERIKSPLSELLVVELGAFRNITEEDVKEIIRQRKKMPDSPLPHKCAIVISSGDAQGWNLAKFYEGMVTLHDPMVVIVFGDEKIARIWLGIKQDGPEGQGG